MELTKKKIVVFVDWYLPAFKAGGPIRSVYNLVSRLSDEFDFYVVTGDRDLGDKTAFGDIELNRWLRHENSNVIYLSKENQNRKYLGKLILEVGPNSIYVNSLFSFSFALLPLSLKGKFPNIQFILAPRGMLGSGALEIKSGKKKIFLGISKSLNLFRHIIWHATNEKEKKEITSAFGENLKCIIADNLSNVTKESFDDLISLKSEDFNRKRFLFVGRISRVKNIDLLVKWFNKLTEKGNNAELKIIGNIEDRKYYNELMIEVGSNNNISILDAIHPEKLSMYFAESHFFCLPSKSENFGHAIIEALSYACPVIISDQTPWRGLFEKNIGWDLSLDDPDSFGNIIQECVNMNEDEYVKMAQNAFEFARENNYKEDVLNAYRNLLS